MKNKYIQYILLFIFFTIPFTNVFWNVASLVEGDGFIPDESNIFSFSVILFDEGSSGYWRYGEDDKYYYFFSLWEENTYFYIGKENKCTGFDKLDFNTWCSAIKMKQGK